MSEIVSRRFATIGVSLALTIGGITIAAPMASAGEPVGSCADPRTVSSCKNGGTPGPEAFPNEFECYGEGAAGAFPGAVAGNPPSAAGGALIGCGRALYGD